MNRNSKLIKRGLTTSLAVGMSVMVGAMPVYAASSDKKDNDDKLYKEETVYVNADAAGNTDEITVSNWLKNSGDVSGKLTDKSTLNDIKNVKGDEKYTADGDKITWNTDGKDIYYQGTTDKELPVSVKLTYYLDGKEIQPNKLKGKSGHLKIKVNYENKSKKNVEVNGKTEDMYTVFVMMTGMILPNDNFTNVTIDNGKVISDGNRSIVVGFGMPGLKESLNIDDIKNADDLTIPESLEVEADVTDFEMSSTFTVGLSDLTKDLDLDNITDMDSLQDALDELDDAALELVSGSDTLSDGTKTLANGVDSYTEGADTLNDAIQKYLSKDGELSGSVTEYVNGVNKVVKGVNDYAKGTTTLANGVTSYVGGEKKLAKGAKQLTTLSDGLTKIQGAIDKMKASTDGKGEAKEDLTVASAQLAAGTKQLKETLGSKEVQTLLTQVDGMVKTGKEMIAETESLQTAMNTGIAAPVQQIGTDLESLQKELGTINTQLGNLQKACEAKVTELNKSITDYNDAVDKAQTASEKSKKQIDSSVAALEKQKENATAAEKKELNESINALKDAKDATKDIDALKKQDKVSITMPSVDPTNIQKIAADIQKQGTTFENTAMALQVQLPEMQKKLDAIAKGKDALPQDDVKDLTTKIDALNAGMEGLDKGIVALAGGINELDGKTSVAFPKAQQGIAALNKGFSQLSSYNDALTGGALKLKKNSPTLVAGVSTLQSGTNKLANGLNTLGSQLSEGSAKLSSNSDELRSGADKLSSGAEELANGADKFQKEGTGKLKSTFEDELGDVLDRFDALTSDKCAYKTYSGRDKSMDGAVKFVIETDEIK
ncbi:hypothetical protein [Dorea sp. AM10-31]|uniref:hypothetical protein n=1 Tax=Dorea sp. AM10-31 TaxID=2293098 RepID=UPI000E41DB55|nr:hypothetical protein [Dorea sp. AM10-31]RGF25127.1 hypothetical protein DW125_03015 [Dorea sp. AM10-31]